MPLRALSIAATGGRALMGQIDTIANNLANVNTTAFKRQRANFADLFYQQVSRAGFGEAGRNQNPTGLSFGTGVRLVSTEKLFEQGVLQATQRDFDLAIDGAGFLRVRQADGTTVAYTRAGNLNIDREGNLVTADGLLLDPPITVPDNVTRIFIDQTGRVQGFDPQNQDTLQDLGQLELTRFVNPAGLEAVGDNLYRETPAAGTRIEGQPAQDPTFGLIRQGFLEQSNVDVVRELVDLITAQRAFETNAKTIEAADQVLQAVNNLRR
jgi:flagellar basal-body rod protein FlgG